MTHDSSYAGDLDPKQAWERLSQDPRAALIDVRTQPEWTFVGLPDLTALDKQPVLVSWQVFPTMAQNAAFAEQIAAHGIGREDTLLFLCRSGARSKAAAQHLTSLGYRTCFNISDGFEGSLNEAKHRGSLAGWKAAHLPWLQG